MLDYNTIHGWYTFDSIYRQAVIDAPDEGAHFVEVGSWLGKSTIAMAKKIEQSGKNIKFTAIDSWKRGSWCDNAPDIKAIFDEHGDDIRHLFEKHLKLAEVDHLVEIIQGDSTDTAALFDGFSLDFVFLDADHRYPKVKNDILAWANKIKHGGVIAGDDYDWEGVKQSVDELYGPETCFEGRLWRKQL